MVIDKNLTKFIIFSEESILQALEKISRNKMRIIFAVSENGILEGIMTDGDMRRWLTKQTVIDLHQPVSNAMNRKFIYCYEGEEIAAGNSLFSDGIEYIPLLDRQHRLIAILTQMQLEFKIEGFTISDKSLCFIISEIGNNHNGDFHLAKKLVDMAADSGADCVKFQMRDLKTLYRKKEKSTEDLGTEYTLDLLSRFQLSDENMFRIFDYCRKKRIIPLCTPWDFTTLEKLDNYGLGAFKVASADLINHDFIHALAMRKKPLICSTGMSTEQEIRDATGLLWNIGANFALLHCNSTYPAPFKDINLSYLKRLYEIGNCPIGYSGHERGIAVPIAAVAMGAKIVEKHFTIDRSMEGNDHKVSLLPSEFERMVKGIREVEQAMGDITTPRKISQGEMINRENLAKSLVINQDLQKGKTISSKMIDVRSPGKGLEPYRKNELAGTRAMRDFSKGDFFYSSDLEQVNIKPTSYRFNRPWGVPVRFHDAVSISKQTNMDLLEFHLSYKDLAVEITHYFHEAFDIDFVVHSPELFSGDHILDLCSKDDTYRRQSVKELQKVIDLTRSLSEFFPKTENPYIVVNVGGFTMHSHLDEKQRKSLYSNLEKSLNELVMAEVRIISQTMPPFPWHFGGQRYHNLFVDPLEISDFCQKMQMQICFDVSHSKLACNHFGWSFQEFVACVAPYAAHLHIADADGIDGEGLQIGEGTIDFAALAEELQQYSPEASFIPEIWQGHKNHGEGFWIALNRLEKHF